MRLFSIRISGYSGQFANGCMRRCGRQAIHIDLQGIGSRVASIGDGCVESWSSQRSFSEIFVFVIIDCSPCFDVEAERAALVGLAVHADLAILEVRELP